ncbi:MAG: hypothetical protein QXG03_03275 [Halalkalicoccus sp.]
MTRRTNRRYGIEGRPDERTVAVSRYDLLLGIVPAAFVLAVLASATLAISVHAALVFASLVGALAIADAIALNPPVEST